MTTTRQASRLRSQRAKLVTDEALKLAQLATKRDKNKLAHKQDIVKSIILKVSTILIVCVVDVDVLKHSKQFKIL